MVPEVSWKQFCELEAAWSLGWWLGDSSLCWKQFLHLHEPCAGTVTHFWSCSEDIWPLFPTKIAAVCQRFLPGAFGSQRSSSLPKCALSADIWIRSTLCRRDSMLRVILVISGVQDVSTISKISLGIFPPAHGTPFVMWTIQALSWTSCCQSREAVKPWTLQKFGCFEVLSSSTRGWSIWTCWDCSRQIVSKPQGINWLSCSIPVNKNCLKKPHCLTLDAL